MKKNILYVLTICLTVLFSSCSDEDNSTQPDNTATMRFTPTAEVSELLFRGNGELIIDWGDNTKDTINNTTVDTIRHSYSKKDIEYRIKITTNATTEIAIENNKISNIELGVFPDLEKLTIKDINIGNIDITKNLKLINLILTNCHLSKIDISNNTALQRLYLSDNKIEEIDLTKNSNLITFDANNNLLSSIDLSNNKELTTLSIKNNKLDTISIDENSNVKYIYLNNNQLTNLKVDKNLNIERLEINNNLFASENINLLFQSLSDKNIWGKTVAISGNPGSETADISIATGKGWSVSYK